MRIDERWQKAGEMDKWLPEAFLKERETTCVTACDRFLNANYKHDSVWMLSKGVEAQAVLMHSFRTLFPVLDGRTYIPIPVFLRRFLLSSPVHAIHGVREDVEAIENALAPLGYGVYSRVQLLLMEAQPYLCNAAPRNNVPGLVVRSVRQGDYRGLFEMQMDYEMEEVVVHKNRYNPALARVSLERILTREEALVAEFNGRLVGKINTNARSWTRRGLGGVFVKPPYRRIGIASAMIRAMMAKLHQKDCGALSLYVRINNKPALRAYSRAGFKPTADYCISYMS